MLTDYEIMMRAMMNDERNLAHAEARQCANTSRVAVADCAARLVDAWESGSPRLVAHAKRNLTRAVALGVGHRALMAGSMRDGRWARKARREQDADVCRLLRQKIDADSGPMTSEPYRAVCGCVKVVK